jgi:hypothetical protein
VVQGNIDSIDAERSVLVIKVTSSSNNLTLRADNLIDLHIIPTTLIKSGNNNISLDSLSAKDKLNIKAQWKDNQLTAQEIKLLGH